MDDESYADLVQERKHYFEIFHAGLTSGMSEDELMAFSILKSFDAVEIGFEQRARALEIALAEVKRLLTGMN